MARLGANRVYEHLWMGSAPRTGRLVRDGGYDWLVLCAMEYQPLAHEFTGVRVVHCPLDDDPVRGLTAPEAAHARAVGRQMADATRRGERVLITCWLGRNRSGLVTAHALMARDPSMSATEAIYRVRQARGSGALSNPRFIELLRSTPAPAPPLIWTP